jgi:hypothetical protein
LSHFDNNEHSNLSPAVASTVFLFNGRPVRLDILNRLSLTDMWKAGGAEQRNKPKQWLANNAPKRLHNRLLQGQNSALESGTGPEPRLILEVIHGGPNAGTWACIELALAYAEYLDEEFWLWVLRTFVQVRTGQLVPAVQAPAVILSAADVERIAEAVSPKVAELVAPKVAEILRPQFSESISQLSRQLEEVKVFLRHDAINGRHNIRQFIERQLSKSPVAGNSARPQPQAPQAFVKNLAQLRADCLAWRNLMSAAWIAWQGRPSRASDFVALAEAGLFDAGSDRGRALQFASAAARCEGASYWIQEGAVEIRLRRGPGATGSPRLYWLEPKF